MFTLTKEFRFEASHQLMNHDGKCARLHGHSWRGRVIVQGSSLGAGGPKDGMLIDYSDLKSLIEPIVENFLDHHHLNATLEMEAPTSERVAQWVFHRLEDPLNRKGAKLVAVQIDETCTSSAEYRP